MNGPLDWSLLYGAFPAGLTAVGGLSVAYVAWRPDRRWWTRVVPLLVVVGAVVAVVVQWLVNDVLHPFPDRLPYTVTVWTGVLACAVACAAARARGASWPRRALSVLAVFVVFLCALNHVNTLFGYDPNLRDALGLAPPNAINFANAATRPSAQTPSTMPSHGEVTQVHIPGIVSGFKARDAWLYLPPAYLVSHRPSLPVLMMLEGQPGDPRDWLNGGNLAQTMDAYAAAHHGLAPVVVMPDDLGSFWGNPLCMDSRLGNADTYLSVDVPTWVRAHLAVDDQTAHWAVGGASYGGTCAWQLAVLHPKLFPTFVDIAGLYGQTLGTEQQTVDAAFGGNTRRFAEVNPVQILIKHTRPTLWGTVAVGNGDEGYVYVSQLTAQLSRHAGMHIRWYELQGGHSYELWANLLAGSMGWLGDRMGIT